MAQAHLNGSKEAGGMGFAKVDPSAAHLGGRQWAPKRPVGFPADFE